MRPLRPLFIASIAAAMIGGGGEDSEAGEPNRSPPPVACTEIGCESGVFLDLTPIERRLPEAARARLCLRQKCRTYSPARNDLVNLSVRGLRPGQRVSVRLTLLASDGRVLRHSAVRAPVRKAQPNGPQCPPTCFQVAAALDRQTLRLEVT